MQTIAGGRDFIFREGRALIVLLEGATLLIANAMFAPSASRSLISFKDLRANGIHTLTIVKNNKEALLLQRETEVLTTAYVGCGGLYELPIRSGGNPTRYHLRVNLLSHKVQRGLRVLCPYLRKSGYGIVGWVILGLQCFDG